MSDNHAQSPQELFNDVVRGLHQLPATDAITFRGTTSPRNRKPAILVTQSITATSRDLSAATAGLTSPGIAVVVLRTGRDLTPLSAVPRSPGNRSPTRRRTVHRTLHPGCRTRRRTHRAAHPRQRPEPVDQQPYRTSSRPAHQHRHHSHRQRQDPPLPHRPHLLPTLHRPTDLTTPTRPTARRPSTMRRGPSWMFR